MPDDLRGRIAGEEFDYLALLHALREYARPRDRITELLRRGEIDRLRIALERLAGRDARKLGRIAKF